MLLNQELTKLKPYKSDNKIVEHLENYILKQFRILNVNETRHYKLTILFRHSYHNNFKSLTRLILNDIV